MDYRGSDRGRMSNRENAFFAAGDALQPCRQPGAESGKRFAARRREGRIGEPGGERFGRGAADFVQRAARPFAMIDVAQAGLLRGEHPQGFRRLAGGTVWAAQRAVGATQKGFERRCADERDSFERLVARRERRLARCRRRAGRNQRQSQRHAPSLRT